MEELKKKNQQKFSFLGCLYYLLMQFSVAVSFQFKRDVLSLLCKCYHLRDAYFRKTKYIKKLQNKDVLLSL